MPEVNKVVMVDDEKDLCAIVKDNLESTHEFSVVTTSNPLEAEAVIRRENPQVILLDMVMPGRKGTEIVAALKKDPALKGIPIIAVSGKGEMVYDKKKDEFKWQPNNPAVKSRGTLPDAKGAEALAKAYEVADYVSKPFTTNVLVDVIKDVLARTSKKTESSTDDGFV